MLFKNKTFKIKKLSGGPLEQLNDGELIGVLSTGNDCKLPEMYGIYTSVAMFRDWIKVNSGI